MTYLASPYSHPDPSVRQLRFEAACRASAELVRGGEVVYSPIVQNHPLVAYGLPTGWEYWEWFDREVLALSDQMAVLMLDGWRDSVGLQAELSIARDLEIPVRYVAPGAPTLAHGAFGGRP